MAWKPRSRSAAREIAFWQAYLAVLRDFTLVDPACGSGAFLVAAFDEMARRYRDAASALSDLGVEIAFDIFDEIVTKNLFGVDLNRESVEITRLSLWLKTARREHRLQNLEATIKCGDSLIDDPAFTEQPFDWRAAFPDVFARGGFDVVIGNPPYVRMELLKPVKPYLQEHYVVAADRADLYAYFFERGAKLLKPGGRLGYISSSTFFRTGSGENLRLFLTDGVGIESVVDFGDIQVFEGVTTYPAILTLKKGEGAGDLAFLIVKDEAARRSRPRLRAGRAPMPRARLGSGSWRFEDDALAGLRDKIAKGRKTLGEVYGPPLYGIKTGFNEAFVIDRATRDQLVAADPRSAELLKPFLRGEDIKRWRVESEDLFLINTPKGKVDIARYPAIRDWLLPFKAELENRATRQEWWELQQAQLAYQPTIGKRKNIVWPHFQNERHFRLRRRRARYLEQQMLFHSDRQIDRFLCLLKFASLPGSSLFSESRTSVRQWLTSKREAQYVETSACSRLPLSPPRSLVALAQTCTDAARARFAIQSAVRHRLLDLAPPERRKLTGKLENWHELDFAAFRDEVKTSVPRRHPGEAARRMGNPPRRQRGRGSSPFRRHRRRRARNRRARLSPVRSHAGRDRVARSLARRSILRPVGKPGTRRVSRPLRRRPQ